MLRQQRRLKTQRLLGLRHELPKHTLLANRRSLAQKDRTQFESLLVVPLLLIRLRQRVERFEIERLPRARLPQVIE